MKRLYSTTVLKKMFIRTACTFVALFAIQASVLAQGLPATPPSGYDTSGQYPAGSVNDVSYYSSVAGTTLTMKVYTPPDYDPNKKYGVIYCYQGGGTDTGTIFADWCVGAGILCDNLLGQGKISKGVIIVALDDQYNGVYGSDVRNMTITDAIPYVDSHYSTYADADHRGVYGYSWGGYYTYDIGCENLNYFRYISPTSAAPGVDSTDTLFPNGGADAKQKMKCLFISYGQNDASSIIDENLAIHQYCVNNNIPHYYWIVEGQGHTSGTWRPAMWNFLQMADKAGISTDPYVPTGAVKLIARHSGKAMDAYGAGTSNGTQIIQWTYGGGTNQQWLISPDNGYYKIVGVQSGKAVEVSGGGTANGSKVQLWDYYGYSWQKFSITGTDSGYFRISPSHATSSCLDVSGVSTSDGALVQLWQWLSGNNQQWAIRPVDGTYKLIAKHSGQSLDAYNAYTANGTQIDQYPYWGGSNQKWTVTDTGNGVYKVIGVQSGKAVEVSGGGTSNGTKIQLWDYYGYAWQKFNFLATDTGVFEISPTHASSSCLDVSGGSTANGASVQLWGWWGGSNQQWSLQAP